MHDWTRVILVGGQSLTTWVKYYKITLPAFEGPYLTADADFLGTKVEAEVIADYLKGTVRVAALDDHTINTATIVFKGETGEKLNIDILAGLIGVERKDVEKLAVPIQIDDYEPVMVLHPLLVLESRCANLERLSYKRNSNGITQAQVACTVVAQYIDDCLSIPERRREALNAARRIATLAQSSAGVFVWKEWGIDVMDTIDPAKMPGEFMRAWQHEIAEVTRKREMAARSAKRNR